jgi:hypothetical protein
MSLILNAGAARADTASCERNAIAINGKRAAWMGSVPSHRNSIEVRTMPTAPIASSTASDPASVIDALAAHDHAAIRLVEIRRRQQPRKRCTPSAGRQNGIADPDRNIIGKNSKVGDRPAQCDVARGASDQQFPSARARRRRRGYVAISAGHDPAIRGAEEQVVRASSHHERDQDGQNRSDTVVRSATAAADNGPAHPETPKQAHLPSAAREATSTPNNDSRHPCRRQQALHQERCPRRASPRAITEAEPATGSRSERRHPEERRLRSTDLRQLRANQGECGSDHDQAAPTSCR